jgi:hypothetical protein
MQNDVQFQTDNGRDGTTMQNNVQLSIYTISEQREARGQG